MALHAPDSLPRLTVVSQLRKAISGGLCVLAQAEGLQGHLALASQLHTAGALWLCAGQEAAGNEPVAARLHAWQANLCEVRVSIISVCPPPVSVGIVSSCQSLYFIKFHSITPA